MYEYSKSSTVLVLVHVLYLLFSGGERGASRAGRTARAALRPPARIADARRRAAWPVWTSSRARPPSP